MNRMLSCAQKLHCTVMFHVIRHAMNLRDVRDGQHTQRESKRVIEWRKRGNEMHYNWPETDNVHTFNKISEADIYCSCQRFVKLSSANPANGSPVIFFSSTQPDVCLNWVIATIVCSSG